MKKKALNLLLFVSLSEYHKRYENLLIKKLKYLLGSGNMGILAWILCRRAYSPPEISHSCTSRKAFCLIPGDFSGGRYKPRNSVINSISTGEFTIDWLMKTSDSYRAGKGYYSFKVTCFSINILKFV